MTRLLLFLGLALPSMGQTTIFIALTQLLRSGAATGHAIVWGGTAYGAGVYGVGATFTSATTVTFAHELVSSTVHVYVYDGTGKLIRPKDVSRPNAFTVIATFDTATSGRIVVK